MVLCSRLPVLSTALVRVPWRRINAGLLFHQTGTDSVCELVMYTISSGAQRELMHVDHERNGGDLRW